MHIIGRTIVDSVKAEADCQECGKLPVGTLDGGDVGQAHLRNNPGHTVQVTSEHFTHTVYTSGEGTITHVE